MSQNYRYPASASLSISAIGTNGASAPLTSIQVAGETAGGVLEPLLVDANGQLIIDVITSGGATAANQVLEITQLTGIHTDTTAIKGQLPATLGQKAMAASLAVAFASDQSALAVTGPLTDTQLRATAVPVSAAALPLPSGAATSGLQTTGNTSLSSIDGKITACNTGAVVVSSSALPSGAATSGKQDTGNTSLASIDGKLGSLGQKAMAGSAPVVLASDQAAIPVTQSGTWTVQPGNTANTTAWLMKAAGKASANAPARNDYSSVNVTTGAYVQLVASTTSACTEIEIFDSSGQTLVLATGGAGSEVNQINIFPGGNGRVPLAIAAGTRVSIKAVSATANTGEIDINFYS